jgi:hypothetical protein
MNDGKRLPVEQRDGQIFNWGVAAGPEELRARQGCAHLEAAEARGFCGVFARFEEDGTDTAAGPVGMNEEGADLGRVLLRIE